MAEKKKQVKTKPAKTLNDKIDTFSSIEEVAKFYSKHRSFQPSKNGSLVNMVLNTFWNLVMIVTVYLTHFTLQVNV